MDIKPVMKPGKIKVSSKPVECCAESLGFNIDNEYIIKINLKLWEKLKKEDKLQVIGGVKAWLDSELKKLTETVEGRRARNARVIFEKNNNRYRFEIKNEKGEIERKFFKNVSNE